MAHRHLTFANVASGLALVVALSGSGVAAAALAKNSVGSSQIKSGAVKTADLANNAVTSEKVKKDALTGQDIKESSLSFPGGQIVSGPVQSGTLSLSFQEVAEVTFTAPSDGLVLVSASAEFNAGEAGTYIAVQLKQDGAFVVQAEMDPGDADTLWDQRQQYDVVRFVEKGTHTFTLMANEESVVTSYSQYRMSRFNLVFAPEGVAAPPDVRPGSRS